MSAEACESCDGEGRVRIIADRGLVRFTVPCWDCGGTGVYDA